MKPNDRGDRHLKHEQPTPLNKIEAVVVPLIYFGDFCNKIGHKRTRAD
jgi:hypothetical protein